MELHEVAEGECLQTERQHLGKRREGSLRESMSRGPGWRRRRPRLDTSSLDVA